LDEYLEQVPVELARKVAIDAGASRRGRFGHGAPRGCGHRRPIAAVPAAVWAGRTDRRIGNA
jgi:hypothetical protein